MLNNTLNLIAPIQMALESEGYKKPTPIQEQAIPKVLEGHDLLGVAQTGTGKTASFALPILQDLATQDFSPRNRKIKSLVIAPTRELAIQISDSFKTYGKNLNLKTLVVYGGVSQHPQTKRLRQGIDILIATPGRLLDLINQKHIHLDHVQHFVLDEADLMLDMGMIDDVKRIEKFLPTERQTMLFSATMPNEIEKLTNTLLKNPVKVEVTPVSSTVDVIEQRVYFVDQGNKTNLLLELLKDETIESALVFSRTKSGANRIVSALVNNGHRAEAIHGNKTQRARQKALNNFKERKTRILVATDIAARGIDIAELSHVINYNLPEVPETYVHRIGRTGRSGHDGIALSFCAHNEKSMLKGIERLIGKKVEVVEDHRFPLKDTNVQSVNQRRRRKRKPSSGNSDQQNQSARKKNRSNSESSFSKTKRSRKNQKNQRSNNRNENQNNGRADNQNNDRGVGQKNGRKTNRKTIQNNYRKNNRSRKNSRRNQTQK